MHQEADTISLLIPNSMYESGFQKSAVSVRGIRIEYYQKPGGGIPLLILHGWCHSKERWLPFSSELNGRFSIVIPDLPGFGDSDKPGAEYDLQFFENILPSFCSAIHLSLHSCYIIGHSMGGTIAVVLASVFRPRKVILVDAPLLPHWLGKIVSMLGPVSSPLFALGRKSDLVVRLVASMTVSDPVFVDPLMIEDARKPTPHSALSSLKAFSEIDLRATLADLQTRVLLVHGARDRIIDYHQYESMGILQNTNIKLATIADIGHTPFVEKPDVFRSICSNFLDDNAV